PAEEEAQMVLRRNRLDLTAQPAQSERVDAREQRPLAPLRLLRSFAVAAAQDETLGLELCQLGFDARNAQPLRQLARCDRADDADPAAHRIDQLDIGALRRTPAAVFVQDPPRCAQL